MRRGSFTFDLRAEAQSIQLFQPTQAKYAKVYPEHEIAKEKDLQKVYVWCG